MEKIRWCIILNNQALLCRILSRFSNLSLFKQITERQTCRQLENRPKFSPPHAFPAIEKRNISLVESFKVNRFEYPILSGPDSPPLSLFDTIVTMVNSYTKFGNTRLFLRTLNIVIQYFPTSVVELPKSFTNLETIFHILCFYPHKPLQKREISLCATSGSLEFI